MSSIEFGDNIEMVSGNDSSNDMFFGDNDNDLGPSFVIEKDDDDFGKTTVNIEDDKKDPVDTGPNIQVDFNKELTERIHFLLIKLLMLMK